MTMLQLDLVNPTERKADPFCDEAEDCLLSF